MSESNNSLNFIEELIELDLENEYPKKDLKFRFPPEPNGFLHIGHLKAIDLNFSLGQQFGASVNLRFDDTNPTKESKVYVDAIKSDIQWLGYKWEKECYASDYFDQLYSWAIHFINEGIAYVDSQDSESIAIQKGTTLIPGSNSPFRDRTIDENLKLFKEMKRGSFKEGSHVLRAKIDMSSPNFLLRDPVMYRIMFKSHHRTHDKWCIYPMYDWTHGQSDYIERITHSLCTLEFKPHRDLYSWFLKQLPSLGYKLPKQREFARLNLSYTVTSKRKLAELVEKGHVLGWDDPRMPTISGLKRRGYTPEALKKFIKTAGVSKRENMIDVSLLEFCAREHLNLVAPRVMAVLNPIKIVITNYPENKQEQLEAENNPEDLTMGSRKIMFSKNIFIERDDFKEEANRKFFRLSIGKEVRLKNAYIVKAISVSKDSNGRIQLVNCEYDPKSKSGSGTEESQRKVKGTLHWVSESTAIEAQVNVYDRLFDNEFPDKDKQKNFLEFINKNSLKTQKIKAEESLISSKPGEIFQFQRLGYFVVDKDSRREKLIFNKTVGLRDNWRKTT